MLGVNRGGVKISVRVHGQLMDVYGDVLDPFEHVAGLLVEYGEIAHAIAGIDPLTVGHQAERHDVCPFVDVGAV